MVRVKRRYVVLSSQKLDSQDSFVKELHSVIGQLYGDFGIACVRRGFAVKRFDQKQGIVILGVRKGNHEFVMSSAPFMKDYQVTNFHLSGTLRGCLKVLKKHHLMELRRTIAETLKHNNEHNPSVTTQDSTLD